MTPEGVQAVAGTAIGETDTMEAQTEAGAGKPALDKTKTVQDYAQEYLQVADDELPVSLGFSARLNMLWDLAGAAPPQIEGRVLSILGINSAWRESDVRKWLQKDVPVSYTHLTLPTKCR